MLRPRWWSVQTRTEGFLSSDQLLCARAAYSTMSLLRATLKLLEVLFCIFLLANQVHSRRYSSYVPISQSVTTTKEGIRLARTHQECSGSVQVRSNDSWLHICQSTFTTENAFVACRELGCGFAWSFHAQYIRDIDTLSSAFHCSGHEEHLSDCPSTALDPSTVCNPTLLYCGEKPTPPKSDVYSMGLSSRVFEGQPHVIKCSVDAIFKVTSFVLRIEPEHISNNNHTEFTQPAESNTAHFFIPPMPAARYYYSCQYNCEFNPNNFCSEKKSYYNVESSPVRLVGTQSRCLGTLEVEHSREWRPVKQQLWGLKEAAVVCRQLDCGSVVHTHTQSNVKELQPVWSFYSNCEGSERALLGCGSFREGMSTSTVHVTCSETLLPAVIRIECERNCTEQDPVIVLSPYTFYIYCSVPAQFPGGHFSLVFTGDKTTHTQNQTAVNHTAIFRFVSAEQSHAGLYRCIYHNTVSGHHFSSQSKELSVAVKVAEDVMLDDGSVRDPGRPVCSGTLFVKEWGSRRMIAGDNQKWDMGHASIVCRQLGCGNAVSTSKIKLPKVITMWNFFSDCNGTEAALLNCGVVVAWLSSTAIQVACAAQM